MPFHCSTQQQCPEAVTFLALLPVTVKEASALQVLSVQAMQINILSVILKDSCSLMWTCSNTHVWCMADLLFLSPCTILPPHSLSLPPILPWRNEISIANCESPAWLKVTLFLACVSQPLLQVGQSLVKSVCALSVNFGVKLLEPEPNNFTKRWISVSSSTPLPLPQP